MDRFERLERSLELERLRGKRKALEDKAGLSEIMERAREGSFLPLGIGGEEVSSQEYFAYEHDYLRDKTRDAYFSVANMESRKELIATQALCESRLRKSFQEDKVEANREFIRLTAKVQRQPWVMAALSSIIIVALGYSFFGLVGAIGGAVGGFFVGQGVISAFRNEANAELSQASNDLEYAQKSESEDRLMPDFFSSQEERCGERDSELDSQTAWGNYLQSKSKCGT